MSNFLSTKITWSTFQQDQISKTEKVESVHIQHHRVSIRKQWKPRVQAQKDPNIVANSGKAFEAWALFGVFPLFSETIEFYNRNETQLAPNKLTSCETAALWSTRMILTADYTLQVWPYIEKCPV